MTTARVITTLQLKGPVQTPSSLLLLPHPLPFFSPFHRAQGRQMMKRRTEEGEEIEMAGLWKGSVEQLEASVCFCSLELGSGVKTETATTCVCGGVCVRVLQDKSAFEDWTNSRSIRFVIDENQSFSLFRLWTNFIHQRLQRRRRTCRITDYSTWTEADFEFDFFLNHFCRIFTGSRRLPSSLLP